MTISFIMSVYPSVHMEKLSSHWTDFHEIWYLNICQKSVKKIQVSLKSDNNNGYFTRSPMYIYNILLNSSENEMFPKQVAEKLKMHTLCSVTLF
jgi:hypothetical protein